MRETLVLHIARLMSCSSSEHYEVRFGIYQAEGKETTGLGLAAKNVIIEFRMFFIVFYMLKVLKTTKKILLGGKKHNNVRCNLSLVL